MLSIPKTEDIPRLVELLRDKEISDNTLEIPYPYAAADGERFLRSIEKLEQQFDRPMVWAIHKEGAGLVGIVGFKPAEEQTSGIEIGYWVGKAYWNRGVATEAVNEVTRKGLEEYGFGRISMGVFASNAASCRVAEKCGYRFVARVSGMYIKDGRPVDGRLYVADGKR